MAALIEFDGLGENLVKGLVEARDAMVKLNTDTVKEGEALKQLGAEGSKATQNLATTIEGTTAALQEVRKEAAKTKIDGVTAQAQEAGKALGQMGAQGSAAMKQVASSAAPAATAVKQVGNAATSTARQAPALGIFGRVLGGIQQGATGAVNVLRNAGARISGLVQGIRSSLPAIGSVGSAFQQVSGSIGGFAGTALSALGPIGIAVGAVAGGLLKIVSNTDAGQVALDGLGRSGSIVFDKLTGKVTGFFSSLAQGDGVFAKFASGIGSAAEFIVTKLNPAFILLDKIGALDGLKEAAKDGQRLAGIYDTIEDAQISLIASNAANEREINKLNIQLRDRTKSDKERLAIGEQITRLEKERAAVEGKVLGANTSALRAKAAQELRDKKEVSDETKRLLNEAIAAEERAGQQSEAITERAQNRINGVLDASEASAEQRLQKAEARAAQRRQIEDKLAADIAAAQKALEDRVASADLEGADPGRRLELQRNAALEEVRILEQTLLKKKALAELEVRLNAETFSKLTDAQKDAQAQALIDDGTIQLSVKQQEQVASAQFAVWDKYWDERLALDREQRAALLDLQADGFEKERAAFDIELEGRVQKLRESGATEIALAQFIQEQRDQFRSGQVQKAIDQEEELALARINAQVQGSESEFAFRQRIELEKLAAQESFAQQRLQAIKDDTSEEAELTKLQLEAVINGIKEKREELANQQAPFDLFDLLGIKVTDSQKQQILSDLKSIGQNILSFASANIAAQQATVDAQIAASDQIIEDQQRRRDELTALLQQEQEDNDAGLANNLDGIKAEISATKEAEAEALAARKAGLAEKRALAKQQAIIDSATQVSNLITAGSALLKDGALKGIPGTIAAIAFIVSLAATFAGIKAKIKAANNSVPQFKKGGMLPGPSHEQGGIAMVDRRGNQIAEAEGGEYMVNKRSTVKYKHILEGINADTIPDSHHKAIRQIMDMEGIGMPTEVVRHIVTSKEKVIERRDSGNSKEMAALRSEVRGLREDLLGFREQERTRPRGDAKTTVTPTKTVTKRG